MGRAVCLPCRSKYNTYHSGPTLVLNAQDSHGQLSYVTFRSIVSGYSITVIRFTRRPSSPSYRLLMNLRALLSIPLSFTAFTSRLPFLSSRQASTMTVDTSQMNGESREIETRKVEYSSYNYLHIPYVHHSYMPI